MALDVTQLAKDMGAALVASLKKSAPDIKEYANGEAQKLAQTLAMIEKLQLTGKIDDDEARLQLQIQKNAARTVLLTLKGLGLIAVENAINGALAVVASAVNTAVGFALL